MYAVVPSGRYTAQPKDSEIIQDIIDYVLERGPAIGRETVTPAVIARWERELKKLRKSLRETIKREEQERLQRLALLDDEYED